MSHKMYMPLKAGKGKGLDSVLEAAEGLYPFELFLDL